MAHSTTTHHAQGGSAAHGGSALERWTRAGLAELTGPEHGPALGPPPGFVSTLDSLTEQISTAAAVLGADLEIDGLDTLAVRARLLGLRRRGRVSCGGSCHLIRAADGWFAVSLSRPEDWGMLPAWVGLAGTDPDRWSELHERCLELGLDDVIERGAMLGIPIGALPAGAGSHPTPPRPVASPAPTSPAVVSVHGARTAPPRSAEGLRVADLTSMWAGPLCGSILAAAGAQVLKVESTTRPDGARTGSPEFYELLNGTKDEVVVDLGAVDGPRELERLLRSVDVVIESSRPRALRQLGIHADQLLADPDGPDIWVAITGHGRQGDAANRVAFGDDAAVAGGLVAWWDHEPTFCADAIADPLTGLTAAAAVLEALAEDRSTLIDVALSRVASHFAAGPADRR